MLIGSRIGDFRAHKGASIELRDGKGFFLTTPLPPFRYAFECPITAESAAGAKRPKRSHTEQLVTQALSLASPLRRLGEGLWVYVFIVVPVTIATFGLLVVWLPLLLVLLVWLAVIVIMFRRSWLRLHPDKPAAWRSDAALMVLSPLGAIRVADRLTRSALADLGGLRVASVIAAPDEFCRLARLIYFDDDAPTDEGLKAEIDQIVESTRLRSKFDAAPTRDSGMLGFCRRCHTQVMRADGTCPDCVTQPITPFEKTDKSAAALS
jgi:hypothetical protein